MSKEIHAEICKELNELYIRKNNDYGDSFAKLRSELPDAILVRIYDKYSRLKTLMRGTEQKVFDESIEDSLRDLANYCLMELVERRKYQPIKDDIISRVDGCTNTSCIFYAYLSNEWCSECVAHKIEAVKYDDIEYVDPKTGKITKLSLG